MFLPRAGRPLVAALGVAPFVWKQKSISCEEKPKPAFVNATCVKNEAHTHNTRKITLQLDQAWTQKSAIANVLVKVAVGGAAESGCCACCKCPPPCGCPKGANGCCACCKCDGVCGCPKQAAPAAAAAEGCCACCKCPPPCGCPKGANGCCACCKCDGICGCPKQAAPVAAAAEGCCACCKCPSPCGCPKSPNGCCACCKCPDKCGCPKTEVAKAGGPVVAARPYNPLSASSGDTLTLLVKKYDDSKVGAKLHALQKGEAVEVKGPNQQWTFQSGKYSHYAMVAGGTGITPLIQAAEDILKNGTAKITFLTFNRTPDDVLLKQELEMLKITHPGRLEIAHHVESGEGTGCSQAGRCCMRRILKDKLPKPGEGVLVMVCGRKEMTEHVAGPKTPDFKQGEVDGVLKSLGYESKHVWKV